MYGATKQLTNQAFALKPCDLAVYFHIENSDYDGSLYCYDSQIGDATIHLTLHDITTGSTTKGDVQTSMSGIFERPMTFVPGHSYTLDAKYDGDICCLEPASATTSTSVPSDTTASIDVPASTGSTQESNNTQQ